MNRIEKILLSSNIAISLIFLIFSFSYVDLNLTISQNTQVLKIIQAMQNLGYYQRPYATLFFLTLTVIAFCFLILNLYLLQKNKIGKKYIFASVAVNTLILIFSYPFLSYDIFNYMFDAKIITTYSANPYTHKPLDFPQDEWLRFMRWTHRYSPYGPLWLAYSAVPSFLGIGKFLITLILFKVFIGLFHILNTYLIFKIAKRINEKSAESAALLYSLNPVFLIEGVINAHNDIVVATALLLSVYFLQRGKRQFFSAALLIGALIKYITVIILPIFLIASKQKLIKLQLIESFVIFSAATMAVFTVLYSTIGIRVPFVSSSGLQVQFQPWYLFWTLPLLILINSKILKAAVIIISLGSLLRYIPYLYYGDWSQKGTVEFMFFITFIPFIFAAALTLKYLKQRI